MPAPSKGRGSRAVAEAIQRNIHRGKREGWGKWGHLSTGGPNVGVSPGSTRALEAHLRLHDKLHHKGLLQDGAVKDGSLHLELQLDAPRVRLCPQKSRIHQLHLLPSPPLPALSMPPRPLIPPSPFWPAGLTKHHHTSWRPLTRLKHSAPNQCRDKPPLRTQVAEMRARPSSIISLHACSNLRRMLMQAVQECEEDPRPPMPCQHMNACQHIRTTRTIQKARLYHSQTTAHGLAGARPASVRRCPTSPSVGPVWMLRPWHSGAYLKLLVKSRQCCTLERPLIRFRQNVNSSFDSRAARTQCFGGCRYLSHCLHQSTVTCFCIPSVMSTWDRMQAMHMLVGFGEILVPHRQHSLHSQYREFMLWFRLHLAGNNVRVREEATDASLTLAPPPSLRKTAHDKTS